MDVDQFEESLMNELEKYNSIYTEYNDTLEETRNVIKEFRERFRPS